MLRVHGLAFLQVDLRLLAVRDQIEESLVNARVIGEFGMESRGHGSSLPDSNRVGAFGGDDLDALADVLDFGGADEDHFQRRGTEQALADGAVDLASVGVAADADVERAEPGLLGVLHFRWRAG